MLLTTTAMMNDKDTIKIVFTAAAKVGGMLFQNAVDSVINRHNNTDAKHRFAKNNE